MNVHFIGELVGASGVDLPNLSCHYKVVADDAAWVLQRGEDENFTQTCANRPVVWNHPLDLCYSASSVAAWPSLLLEVWSQDEATGLNTLAGYGNLQLPSSPGHHPHLDAVLWRPVGSADAAASLCERLRSAVMAGGGSGGAQLGDPAAMLTAERAGFSRALDGVVTEAAGVAAVSLHVVVSTGHSATATGQDDGSLSLGAKGVVLASSAAQG